MFPKKAILAMVSAALLAGMLVADRSATDPTICPLGPWKFAGMVVIVKSPGSQKLLVSARAWKGGVEVKDGTMKVMGMTVPFARFGYVLDAAGPVIRPGDTVQFSFKHPWTGSAPVTARCVAPTAIRFVSPAHGAHVAVDGAGSLAVSWSGGTPPYNVFVYQVEPHVLVFHQYNVGASVSVPFARFSSGGRYQVSVDDTARAFTFHGAVDAATSLALGQAASIDFIAD